MYVLRQLIAVLVIGITTSVVAEAADNTGQKAVLVTGASSGIGLKITQVLAANGFYVYAGARKEGDLERLDAMENVSSLRLDVTKQAEIDAAVAFVEQQGRGLWGIVNNAGVGVFSPLASGPLEDLTFTLDVNVIGPYRVNQAFLPLVTDSRGRTATIGSINGFIASPLAGAYVMSKFAMEGYTDTLAMELQDVGVQVAVVEPGSYKTRIRDKVAAYARASAARGNIELTDETRKLVDDFAASNESMKEPDEVAEAVLHFMTSDAPKRRYLVTPNERQAAITIQSAMQRVVELNEDQPYSLDRDQLVAMLDELLEAD